MKIRKLISILTRTSHIDIYDLNYLFSSKSITLLADSAIVFYKYIGVFKRLLIFLLHLIKTLFKSRYFGIRSLQRKGICFCYGTKNQKNALAPIKNRIDGSDMVLIDIYVKGSDDEDIVNFPVALSYILALPYFPVLIWNYITARGHIRESYKLAADHYWFTYGHFLASRIWLRVNKPSVIIIANDHLTYTRSLLYAAKIEKIPTCYIQHASVTTKFPRLDFDYAFLEGEDALRKYAQYPSETKVFLIGMPKFDDYVSDLNSRKKVSRIGICTNPLDDAAVIDNLLFFLRRSFPDIVFSFRPHPGDMNRGGAIWQKMALKHEIEISDSRIEKVFDYLKSVDAIIAGNSNILLEAAMLNVVPIQYKFSDKLEDHYGFIESGLVVDFDSVETLSLYIREINHKKPEDIRQRAKQYSSTIGTVYDGNSIFLVSRLISNIAARENIDYSMWKGLTDLNLEAYELVA